MTADTDTTYERLVTFDSVFNFRDLGGYTGVDGRTVAWRRLFRADGLHRLTSGELGRLADLGIRTVLDLRTPFELEERGRFGAEGNEITYHHLPVLQQNWDRESVVQAEDAGQFLAGKYIDMLTEGRAALASALAIISDAASLPLVFHCAAGKDRTGVLAALTLSLLGVDDDVVGHDYSLSSEAMVRMTEWFRATHPERTDITVDQPRAFLDAPAAAMSGFLELLRAEYGSVEAYVKSVGVTDETIERLRTTLLV
jgi:protein-tyrosine phosphatase